MQQAGVSPRLGRLLRLRHDARPRGLRVQQVEGEVLEPSIHADSLRLNTQHQLLHLPGHQVSVVCGEVWCVVRCGVCSEVCCVH